jgi:hypothetical protein
MTATIETTANNASVRPTVKAMRPNNEVERILMARVPAA